MNPKTRNPTGNPITFLLPLAAFAVRIAAQPVDAPRLQTDAQGDTVHLAPFLVTGSHVARVDYETPSPVITYPAAEIDAHTYGMLGDFVQNLSFNSGVVNTAQTYNSFVTGAGTSNPRGLGSNRFLTLVNGRRAVPYGFTNSINGTPISVFNFNSIPLAAIDHVEFLKDGASAIYGSDAITGVLNVVLKKTYQGAAFDFGISNTLHHDSLHRHESLTVGTAKDGWNVLAVMSHQVQHADFLRDFSAPTTYFSYMGAKGTNLFSLINQPSYVTLTASQAAATGIGPGGVYVIPSATPTSTPKKSDFVWVGTNTAAIPVANRFDPGPMIAFLPDDEQTSSYVSLERQLTDSLVAFAQVTLSRTKTYYDLGYFGISNALNGYTFAADNPYNPFGLALTDGPSAPYAFTFTDRTSQKREVGDTASAFTGGIRGRWGQTWSWESTCRYGVDRTVSYTDRIPIPAMRAMLAATTRTTAFNPFGPSDNPALVSSVLVRSADRNNIVDAFSYDFAASGRMGRIPWTQEGEIGLATGYEFRLESLRGHPDGTAYVDSTPNLSFHGLRRIHAVYAELSLPVQRWLEFQLAGRNERYSDFGQTTKPKYSAKLALPKTRWANVLLRGSYSESFKAPDLGQTYQNQTAATTSVRDPLRPQDGLHNVRIILGGNPALKPELGKVQYGGVVLEIPALRGLSLTADYLDIKIRNGIGTVTATYLLSPDGQKQFPSAVHRNDSIENPGPISSIDGISENLASQVYQGIDYGLHYVRQTPTRGLFRFQAGATQLLKRGTDSGLGAGFVNATGRYNAPVWRGNLGLDWQYRNFGTSLTADIVGKFFNGNFNPTGWGENIHSIFNLSVSYRGWRKTVVTLGAYNVLNQHAPQNGYCYWGFDDRAVNATGALGLIVNLRVRREF